jgi:ABC-type amino acid transport system permease subunit
VPLWLVQWPAATYVSLMRGTPLQAETIAGRPLPAADPVTYLQTLRHIIMPQALRIAVPLPLYLAAAIIYWCLSLCFEMLQHRMERRMRRGHV